MQIVVKYSCCYFERPLKWHDLNEMWRLFNCINIYLFSFFFCNWIFAGLFIKLLEIINWNHWPFVTREEYAWTEALMQMTFAFKYLRVKNYTSIFCNIFFIGVFIRYTNAYFILFKKKKCFYPFLLKHLPIFNSAKLEITIRNSQWRYFHYFYHIFIKYNIKVNIKVIFAQYS